MKIVILTSDIPDGRIVSEELIKAGRSISAIIYERKKKRFRTQLRLLLLFLSGKLRYINFEDMGRRIEGLSIKATDDINTRENIDLLAQIAPHLIVVVGTRRLKSQVFNSASIGTINLHSGILPFYRGADSELWALYNNDPHHIGVTVHFIDEGLDSGEVIISARQRVNPKDSYSQLRKKNIYLGATKINEVIDLIEAGDYSRMKQDANYAKTYYSATKETKDTQIKRQKVWLRRSSCLKTFKDGLIAAEEYVARRPLIALMEGSEIYYPRTFCFRIDADEYHSGNFSSYLNLFKRYRDAITIFVNAKAFSRAKDSVSALKKIGVDIQSHGFYHHTYNDFESNRYNISKAKSFFEELGIRTIGFAAPMGRWNRGLMRALEEEGYEYSSDFAYDYLGLPSYPNMGKCISKILEIPVFPVCPELFFQKGIYGPEEIFNYYKSAVDEMESCAIPVILYAHTSLFRGAPDLLADIAEYALSKKRLRPVNMTEFCKCWKKRPSAVQDLTLTKRIINIPNERFLGKRANIGTGRLIKECVKRAVDFERVTPDRELRSPAYRKILKHISRKVI